jgi:aldehyde:ferredoxin oxidoreductase
MLFPEEWDDLQSLPETYTPASAKLHSSEQNGIVEKVLFLKKLRILADMNSICPLVVVRLQLVSDSDIGQLVSAATGILQDSQKMETAVYRTIQIERTLLGKGQRQNRDPLPLRFFRNPAEKSSLEEQIKVYNTRMESNGLSKEEEF